MLLAPGSDLHREKAHLSTSHVVLLALTVFAPAQIHSVYTHGVVFQSPTDFELEGAVWVAEAFVTCAGNRHRLHVAAAYPRVRVRKEDYT